MTRVKALLLGSLAVLALLLAFGCSLLPREDTGVGAGWYIKLQIRALAGSKGITVTEFDVTGLDILVRDPAGEVLQAIDWAAAEGTQTYLVPVKQVGEHQIEVTHYGQRDGEDVQATENAAFGIQAMKITVIDVVPGCIGVIRVTSESPEGPSSWQLYGTWVNEMYNDLGGPAAKIIIYESGVAELYKNVLDSDPFETFPFQVTNEWTDEQSHWFEAIAYGSAYMLCRIHEGGKTLEVVTSEVTYYRQE